MWNDVLDNWENGIVLKYPKQLKERFEWNTSVLKENSRYKQTFRTNINLPNKQDYSAFQEYIKKTQNKYVVAFPSLSQGTILVVPIPRPGKNYVTLKDFIDNAPLTQQKEFWKKVSEVARQYMKLGDVWISVHGLGVPYTHVRIDSTPKYYFKTF